MSRGIIQSAPVLSMATALSDGIAIIAGSNPASFNRKNMEWINVKDKKPTSICIVYSEKYGIHTAKFDDDMERYIVGGWEVCNYCGGESQININEISH